MMEQPKDFDPLAASWDELPRRVALARAVAQAMLRELPVSAQWDAVDYGAGTGLVTLAIEPKIRSITAVDSSVGMLRVLERKLSHLPEGKVRVLHVDAAENAPLPGPFDLALSSMTLHHVQDPTTLLRALYGALRPGGYVAIADLDEDGGRFHDSPEGVFHNGFARDAVERMLDESGFVERRIVTAATVDKPVADAPSAAVAEAPPHSGPTGTSEAALPPVEHTRSFSLFLAIGRRPRL